MIKKAIFSKDKKYRYWLKREWDYNKPTVNFICLNPSVADEVEDDKMVTKCIRQADKLGFGNIEMTNLFSFVDTKRTNFYDISDPIGEQNDIYVLKAAKRCDKIVIAWGNEGVYKNRSEIVLKKLLKLDIRLYCLKLTSIGQPHHPGRLGYIKKLVYY